MLSEAGKRYFEQQRAAEAERNGHVREQDSDVSLPPEPPPPDDDAAPEPAPPFVDGAELLDDVERFVSRFLAFPSKHCIPVIALWAVHTWALAAFYVTPRLILDSPEPNSGKTRVLEVLVLLCRGAKLTLSTTTAALYRRIEAAEDKPPTVLQDEADAIFGRTTTPQAEDLRALFNSGYKRGATVDRCEGDAKNMKVREFKVFAPVALAGLAGRMPATITSRGFTMHMRRRAPDEHVDEFRGRDAAAEAEPIREGIEAWAEANLEALTAARPKMPEGVRDRAAENWEAILAVADLVGGDWPERARAACRHFVLDSDADELSLGARLLRDARSVFGDRDRMFSADLVSALTAGEESEWSDLWGKPLNQNRLAKELKRYGVRSDTIRIGAAQAKGYLVDGEAGLAQAWQRYLPNVQSRTSRTSRNIAGQCDSDPYQSRTSRTESVPGQIAPDLQLFNDGTAGTLGTPTDGLSPKGSGRPPLCPGCSRAPTRTDTGLCDLCTVKASKQDGAR